MAQVASLVGPSTVPPTSTLSFTMSSRIRSYRLIHFPDVQVPDILSDQVMFRTVTQAEPGLDITGLARAAVAGDERALDLFSSWYISPLVPHRNAIITKSIQGVPRLENVVDSAVIPGRRT